MGATRTAKTRPRAPAPPRIFVHGARPEWGRAIVTAQRPDRTTYLFERAGERTFLRSTPAIVEIDLAPDERVATAARIREQRPVAVAPALPRRRKEARVATPPAPRFDRQLAVFTGTYPNGLAEAPGHAQAAALARDLLAEDVLDAAIARGAWGDVLASAVRVLVAARSLLVPKADVTRFEVLATSPSESVARALRDSLYGEGEPEERAGIWMRAIGDASWPLSTIFLALVDPQRHFFVKATLVERQAVALGLAPPPTGMPSAAGYAQHLAVAQAVRRRLAKAGLAPRDLLDVYTFAWATLRRASTTTVRVRLGARRARARPAPR